MRSGLHNMYYEIVSDLANRQVVASLGAVGTLTVAPFLPSLQRFWAMA